MLNLQTCPVNFSHTIAGLVNKNKTVHAHLLCHLCVPSTGRYSLPGSVAVCMTFHENMTGDMTVKIRSNN